MFSRKFKEQIVAKYWGRMKPPSPPVSDGPEDQQFLSEGHVQYSKKHLIRIRKVMEEIREDIEQVSLETMKQELDLRLGMFRN